MQLHYQFKKSPNFPLIVGFTANRIKIYKLLSRIILQWQWYCFQYPRTLWRHWKISSNVWLFNTDIVSSFWLQREGCWFDWLSMLFQLFKSSSIWHHGNGFASTKLPSSELSCIYNSFLWFKAQGSCYSSYRETGPFGIRWRVRVLTIFLVAWRCNKDRKAMYKGFWCKTVATPSGVTAVLH